MSITEANSETILLHNPRCSKSRALKVLLDERGVSYQERRYLEEPLSRAELDVVHKALGRPVGEWTRSREAAFAEAGLEPGASEDELLGAMVAHPVLMERPILLRAGVAKVGRPPEDALSVVD